MDDFDDAIVADYQYDLWRMAVSIVLDCRSNVKFSYDEQRTALEKFAHTYLKEISSYEPNDITKETLLTRHNTIGLLKEFLDKVAKRKSRKKMLRKWTFTTGKKRTFNYDLEKLERISESEYAMLIKSFESYKNAQSRDNPEWTASHFKVKDIARRLWSGTGSLECDRFYVLLEGDHETDNDDIILDVKALNKPPLYDHMNDDEWEEYNRTFQHEGERYVEAFKALTEHPDKYLGWLTYNDVVFSVRERSPFKSDFPTERLNNQQELYFMAETWGKLLAVRHERASHRLNNDPYTLPKQLKQMLHHKEVQFIDLVADIAMQYADCVEMDWNSFREM